MEVDCVNPLVSIPVITYNSSNTIIETLDSIYNQTYQNIELIVSDDCSTDNTIELCQKWIELHRSRFSRVELIKVKKNTGVSANCNRARVACHGEWVKSIAGDDMLMSDAISVYVDYISKHENVVYLFGKCKAFGADKETCEKMESMFNYNFFNFTKEQKLYQLIYGNNCVPATTAFYNREKIVDLGILYDERVPLLEDWTNWINLVLHDIPMHFVNNVTVMYRWGGLCTKGSWSVNYYKSHRQLFFYYQYPIMIKDDASLTVENIIEHETKIYSDYLKYVKAYESLLNSRTYKLGNIIASPFRFVMRLFRKGKK